MDGNSGFVGNLPLGTDALSVRRRVEGMEKILERALIVPGLNRGVGLDVVFDLVPFGGTTIAAIMGLYMVWEARNLHMPKSAMARMLGNVGLDWALGLIPWFGAVPDFFFRSNTRNLKIIKKFLDKHHPSTATVEHP